MQVFNGNSGKNDIVKQSLNEFVSAKYIRFQPTAFSGYKGLRVEVYGVRVAQGTFICYCDFRIYPIFIPRLKLHTGLHVIPERVIEEKKARTKD